MSNTKYMYIYTLHIATYLEVTVTDLYLQYEKSVGSLLTLGRENEREAERHVVNKKLAQDTFEN